MRIIELGRGAGKTYQLVTMAAENKGYIVCRDRVAAEMIFQQAMDRKLDIKFPITFEEFANGGYRSRGIREFMIDDVDILLEHLSGVPISYCTFTPK